MSIYDVTYFSLALSHKIRSLWLLAPFADKDISHVSLKPEITELTRVWDSYLVLELQMLSASLTIPKSFIV